MAGESKKITLVVPVFNEAQRWNKSYWNQVLSIPGIHWIFVNDGSCDETSKILADLEKLPNAVVLEHSTNLGKAEAIRSGFHHEFTEYPSATSGKLFIGYLDADEAFNPEEIERFMNLTFHDSSGIFSKGFQAIWSSRVQLRGRNIERKKYRHYLGRLIASFLGLASPTIPYDSQSGFKIFVLDDVLVKVFTEKFSTKWFVDLEIATRYQSISGRELQIWEEPLLYWKDIGGSAIKFRNLPTIFLEIMRTYFLLRTSSKKVIRN